MAKSSLISDLLKTPSQIRQEREERLLTEGLAQSQLFNQGNNLGGVGGMFANFGAQQAAQVGRNMDRAVTGLRSAASSVTGQDFRRGEEKLASQQQKVARDIQMGNLQSMKTQRQRLIDSGAPAAVIERLDNAILAAEDRTLTHRNAEEDRQRAIAAERRASQVFERQMAEYNKADATRETQQQAIAEMLPAIDVSYMSEGMKAIVGTLEPSQALPMIQAANKRARDDVRLSAFNTTANQVLNSLTATDPSQRPSTSQINEAMFPLIEQAQAAGLADKAKTLEAQRSALVSNTGDIRGQEETLRKQWGSDTALKEQRAVADKTNSALNLLESASAAGDIASIFEFMKSLDPRSVVREGEFDMAQQVGGLTEAMVAKYGKLKDGAILTPEMRKDIANTLLVIAGSNADTYNNKRQQAFEDYSGREYDATYIVGRPLTVPSIEDMTFGATPQEGSDEVSDEAAGIGFSP